jgi:orotate phosphoribosyltransferase
VGYDIQPGDSILIIEDVITAGTAVRESLELLNKRGLVKIEGVLVCLDRMERGLTHLSATQELYLNHNTPVYPLVCLQELIHILQDAEMEGMPLVARGNRMAMEDYLLKYGVSDS